MRVFKIMVMVMGILLAVVGLLMIAVALFAYVTKPEETAEAIIMGLFLGVMPLVLGAGVSVGVAYNLRSNKNESIERDVLTLAREHGGRLSVTQVAMNTNLTSNEADAFLRDLHTRSLVDMEATDDGAILFKFPNM